jgi:hypothetical protein
VGVGAGFKVLKSENPKKGEKALQTHQTLKKGKVPQSNKPYSHKGTRERERETRARTRARQQDRNWISGKKKRRRRRREEGTQ